MHRSGQKDELCEFYPSEKFYCKERILVSGVESVLPRSLNLSCIQKKPFKSQSLRNILNYSPAKFMSNNDQFLLLCRDDHVYLFDDNLKAINSIKNIMTSSVAIVDIAWCALIARFILITKSNALLFDPINCKFTCIERVRLQDRNTAFLSCTCSNEALFIATGCSYYPFYVDQYNLPDFVFIHQYSVIDLIGGNIPPELNWGRTETVTKTDEDRRKICTIRSIKERLGLIIHIESENFLYAVNMTKQFESPKVMLPSLDCKLNTICGSDEWLVVCDDYNNTIKQISLDCQYVTDYKGNNEGQYDKVSDALVMRSSCIVALRGDKLEIYRM